MTVYVIDSENPLPPTDGDREHALVLSQGDSVFLDTGAEIVANGNAAWGIVGLDTCLDTYLSLNGSVRADYGIGLHGVIDIGAHGTIQTRSSAINLRDAPTPSFIDNAGTIRTSPAATAILIADTDAVITNSGLISGGINASRYGDPERSLIIKNSGTIEVLKGPFASSIISAYRVTKIVNSGTITGIELGPENFDDVYDGRGGLLKNQLTLGGGDDLALGGDFADHFIGGSGQDTLSGHGGDDLLNGRSGDDVLSGGEGADVAVFWNNFANYSIKSLPDGHYRIVDHSSGFNDGTDTLTGIEYLQFADRTIALSLPNSAPTSLDLEHASVASDAPVGTVVGLLSGADPDGDALGFALVTNPGGQFRIHGSKLILARPFAGDADIAITVRASDPHGASIDRTFVIAVDPAAPAPGNGVAEEEPDPEEPETEEPDTEEPDVEDGEEPDVEEPEEDPVSVVLYGGRRADKLRGGDGDDHLDGRLGRDKLAGGAGEDAFAFTTKLGKGNVDRILDFTSGEDSLVLARKVFKGLGRGALDEDAFRIGRKAKEADDRILYDRKSGILFFDRDGSGDEHGAVAFARLKAKTFVSADDLLVI